MRTPKYYVGITLAVAVIALVTVAGLWGRVTSARGAVPPMKEVQLAVDNVELTDQVDSLAPDAGGTLVLSYASKFVCTAALQPGQMWYGTDAPIVHEETEIAIHNPNDHPVVLFKKAVLAPIEDGPIIPPGDWREYDLEPNFAFRIDCDDITKLLTNDTSATFIGTYGIGVSVQGFVVIGVGPQVSNSGDIRYTPLDVTSEYVRGSEVMKKDVHFQPWWTWWWWPLPWRLGYAYQRIIPIETTENIDCRQALTQSLHSDVDPNIPDPAEAAATHIALDMGNQYGPTHMDLISHEAPPALVPMIGRCDKIDPGTMSVDFVLFSNKGPTDEGPIIESSQPEQFLYPWVPGIWYDLPVVMPQNMSVDIDGYFRDWHAERWLNTGIDPAIVSDSMRFFMPYWCGWGYWWWWWNGGDCVDIAVGEGESIDVEQVSPVRVFYDVWPPMIP